MLNATQSNFILAAYVDLGLLKYLVFVLMLSLYSAMVFSNVLLIAVICSTPCLHEPMYAFLCSLFVNELHGSTAFFPALLVQVLSSTHSVPAALCFLQNFCLFSYGGVEFFNLAVMSYDRYLAICHPLQYSAVMTQEKVGMLLAVTWLCPLLLCVVMVCWTSSLQLCGNVIHKLYCVNFSIVKLSCSDTTVNNVYGLVVTSLSTVLPLTVILYTYSRILKVCFSASRQTWHKAVSTCAPHIASLLNFFFGSSLEILQSRFNMNHVPDMLRVFLSLYWLTCQPLFNPLLYGLTMSKIRMVCKSLLVTQI